MPAGDDRSGRRCRRRPDLRQPAIRSSTHPIAAYQAARAAQIALVHSVGREMAVHAVRVNGIAPNFIENPSYFPPETLADPRFQQSLRRNVPAQSGWAAAMKRRRCCGGSPPEASYVFGPSSPPTGMDPQIVQGTSRPTPSVCKGTEGQYPSAGLGLELNSATLIFDEFSAKNQSVLPFQAGGHPNRGSAFRPWKVTRMPIKGCTAVGHPVVPARDLPGTSVPWACSSAIVDDVAASDVESLIVLDQDDALIQFDRRLLYRSVHANGHEHDLHYQHRRSNAEQLLGNPDAFAWCWARGGQGGS